MRSPAKYSSSCVAVSFRTGGTSSDVVASVAAFVREPDADQHVAVALEDEPADRGVEGHGGGGSGGVDGSHAARPFMGGAGISAAAGAGSDHRCAMA